MSKPLFAGMVRILACDPGKKEFIGLTTIIIPESLAERKKKRNFVAHYII